MPNTRRNLAVLEFKLATNLKAIRYDFEKLLEFKKNKDLKYTHVIEVIIGNGTSLRDAKECIRQLSKADGEEITMIEFDTNLWKANESKIRYKYARKVA